jgi:hypothetical protein
MFEFLRAPEWGGVQGLLGVLALWIAVLPYVPRKPPGSQTKKDNPQCEVAFPRCHCSIIYTYSCYVRSFELVMFATNEELARPFIVIWLDPVTSYHGPDQIATQIRRLQDH